VTTIPPPRFYCYVLARPDNRVFYVGKGSGHRSFDHEKEARSDCRCHKCNVIRKIWKKGGEVQRYIVFTTDNEAEAYTHEAELIALYGVDTLTNHNGGGEGGTAPDAETRAKIGAVSRAANGSPEGRARMSAQSKAMWQDAAYREALTTERRNRVRTPDAIALSSARTKAQWNDPDYRAKNSAAQKAALERPEVRMQQSVKQRERWANPEHRANQTAINKARAESPEARAHHSAVMKAAWADPKRRARMLAARRATLERNKVVSQDSHQQELPMSDE
jgi:hypothetical protein